MIKAVIEPSGWRLIGLAENNIQELKKGRPIVFDLSALKLPPFKMVIMYGKTEELIMSEVKKTVRITPETEFTDKSHPADSIIGKIEQLKEILDRDRNGFPYHIRTKAYEHIAEIIALMIEYKSTNPK